MKRNYTKIVINFGSACKKILREIEEYEYLSVNYILAIHYYREFFTNVVDLLVRIDDRHLKARTPLLRLVEGQDLTEETVPDVIKELSDIYSFVNSPQIMRLSNLSEEESKRIDEAYHSLVERCYWSAIINSAVALESRLFLILKRRSKKILENIKPDLRFTFGALADAYLNNKSEFGNCIPKRYEHLLKLINEYRIVSAHPKQFKIDQKTADGIFNFTLAFLLDEECEPPKQRGRKKKKS